MDEPLSFGLRMPDDGQPVEPPPLPLFGFMPWEPPEPPRNIPPYCIATGGLDDDEAEDA